MTHSSDPGINKRKAKGPQSILKFMQRLTKPHPAVPEADQRHAQLLSMMLLAFIPLQFIAMLAFALELKHSLIPFADPYLRVGWLVLVLLILEYGLSRTRFYLPGAVAFVISFEFEIIYSAITIPELPILLAFSIIGVVLSAELLSWKATTVMSAVVLVLTFFVPPLSPSFSRIMRISTQLFYIGNSIIVIAIAVYSQRDLRKIKQQSQSLRESEERFRSLFEDSPISLWEEDYSAVKQKIESLREQGVTDFYSYLASHPEIVSEFIANIKVVSVNKATLNMFEAENKEALLANLTPILRDQLNDQFMQELVTIAAGRSSFSREGVNWTVTGRRIDIAMNWAVAPGYENDLSKVIVSIVDITQNKLAAQALQDSEKRYRSLFEDSPISLWEEDFSLVKQKLESIRAMGVTDFYTYLNLHPEIVTECLAMIKILDVNKATLDLYQFENKAALETNLTNIVRDQSNKYFLQELVNLARGDTKFSREGVNWTSTGKKLDVVINWTTALRHEGDLSKMIVSIVDITERKKIEKALQDSEERYRLLFEDSPISIWEEDFSAVQKRLDSLREQGVTDFSAYLTAHPDFVSECIALIKVLDVNKTTVELYQAENKAALLTNLALLLRDPSHQQFLKELIDIFTGRTQSSWEGENWTLTGKKIDIAMNWLAAPGHEIDLSKVLVTIVDITERKRAEQALLESEKRYRLLFEDSPISLWEEDYSAVKQILENLRKEGVTDFFAYLSLHPEVVAQCIAGIKILDVNKTTLTLFQPESKETLLANLTPILRDPSNQEFLEELALLASGCTNFNWEGENWTLTGKRIDVAMNWSAAPGHESDLAKVIVSIVDITQRKQMEQALQDSEERYRLLFLSNPLPSWVYDRETLAGLAVNDAAVEKYGYTREEFLKLSIPDIQVPENLDDALQVAREIPGPLRKIGVWKQKKKDGTIIEVEITTHDLPYEGRNARILVANDITERLRAEKVRETIYNISQVANSSTNLDQLFISVHEMLGKLIPVKNFFLALYDPEIDQIDFPYCIDQYEREFPPRKHGRGLTEYVLRTARPLFADQVVFDKLIEQGEVELLGKKSVEWLGVPLRTKDGVIGVIATQSYEKDIHFKPEDAELLEFVANQVALGVERKRVEELLRSFSLTDDLTGLYNRRGFNLLAEQQMKQAHRIKNGMLLLYTDLDYLKDINDHLGHLSGDQALREVAQVLKETFREADIVARLGGDEFVVLTAQGPRIDAHTLTNRLQDKLNDYNNQNDRTYQLSLSVGVARYDPENPCSLTDLISQADQLMYKQKQTRHGTRST